MSHDARLALIVESHQRMVGRPLLDVPFSPEALWNAPLAIVAHGTEADPVFFYGNQLALQQFEMDFAAFTRMPSRLSAEPLALEERARLLARVTKYGFVDDYSGMRISGRNKRFMIAQATVWNLLDADGVYRGQAAAFTLPDSGLADQPVCRGLPVCWPD